VPHSDYEAQLAYNREWRRANPDKVRGYNAKKREYKREWHAANPEKHAEYKARTRAKDPERYLEHSRKYRRTNPNWKVIHLAAGNRRRASKLKATPGWANAAVMQSIYAVAGAWRQAGVNATVDHIVPLQSKLVCGLHCHDNLTIVTKSENSTKKNRWWPDMPGV